MIHLMLIVLCTLLALLATPLAPGQFDADRQVITALSQEAAWTWWNKS
jgi:hypothetical protein